MNQGTWSVDDTERETEHTLVLDNAKPLELSVSNVHGHIFVRGADRGDVLVQSSKHGRRDTKAHARAHLQIEADGNVIKVHPDYGATNFTGEGFDFDASMDFGRDIVREVVGSMFGKRGEADRERARERGDRVDRDDREDRSGQPRFDLVIEVPKTLAEGSRVNLRTTSGPAGCADLACTVDASSASSNLHFRNIDGPLTIQTASGDVMIEGVRGAFTLRSASGDAQVTDADLTALNINTASGDITLQARLSGSEPSRIHTVSGNVQLLLAAPLPSEIGFKSVSGDAFVPAPYEQTGRKQWNINGGSGAELAVKTVSGDLHVQTSEVVGSPPPPPYAPEPPPPATPPEPVAAAIPLGGPEANGTAPTMDEPVTPDDAAETERLNLLQALERGEIDIEDTMRRLDELDGGSDAPPS